MTVTNLDALGEIAPRIGPWFEDGAFTLPVPTARLSVPLAGAATAVLPPLPGLLSFAANDASILAGFLDGNGTPAFSAPAVTALFRILPEAEVRLFPLMRGLPLLVADASLPDARTPARAVPRWFAVELRGVSGQALANAAEPSGTVDDLGLDGMSDPIRDFKSPLAKDKLLTLTTVLSAEAHLWCFDRSGRAVDPGAVARWLHTIATAHAPGLWADAQRPRTAPADSAMTVHLTNCAEGPLAKADRTRVTVAGASAAQDDGPVLTLDAGADAVALTLSVTEPTPLRIAALPHGPYLAQPQQGAALTLTPDAALPRDFIRVAVVDLERRLTGQPREVEANATTAAKMRAAEQARASTGLRIARATTLTLHTDLEASAAGLLDVFDGDGGTLLATGPLDARYGPAPPLVPDAPPPDTAPELAALPLRGSGRMEGDVARGQSMVVGTLPGAMAPGMLARLWTTRVSDETGRRLRIAAGAGRAGADGRLRIVAALPDGRTGAMRLDLGLTGAALESRYFPNLPVMRPTPDEGPALVPDTLEPGDEIWLPERGEVLPALPIPAGVTPVVLRGDAIHLLDLSDAPGAAFAATTLAGAAGQGDRIDLAPPAFGVEPSGENAARIEEASGAETRARPAAPIDGLIGPGAPVPMLGWLETVAARIAPDGSTAAGALHAGPTLDTLHEGPLHGDGHAGTRAAIAVHGVGASMTGPAVAALHEIGRGRLAEDPLALAQAARETPAILDPGPDGPGFWAVPLRTAAKGAESPVLSFALAGRDRLVLAERLEEALNAIEGVPGVGTMIATRIRAEIAAANGERAVRALDRLLLAAQRGQREGLVAAVEAIEGAEDLIYIEGPALEDIALEDDDLKIVKALAERLAARPRLRVVLCVEARSGPFLPRDAAYLRRARLAAALKRLRDVGDDPVRAVAFAPTGGPGRALRLAATTMIVDDCFLMTGRTHLWRRGLSFDVSTAISVFDETLSDGRPAALAAFRRQLVAGRLGARLDQIPENGADLARVVEALKGSGRLARPGLAPPANFEPDDGDAVVWNPDGETLEGLDLAVWLQRLAGAAMSGANESEED